MNTYSKGYIAGRKRAKVDHSKERVDYEREVFTRQVFLVVLPEMLRQPWKTGEKTWSTMPEYVDGAHKFAVISAKKFGFPPAPAPVVQEGDSE